MEKRSLMSVAAVALSCFLVLGCAKVANQANFDKIEVGMSQKEVKDITGVSLPNTPGSSGQGKFKVTSEKIFEPGNENRYILVEYDDDGKVKSKKKFGF